MPKREGAYYVHPWANVNTASKQMETAGRKMGVLDPRLPERLDLKLRATAKLVRELERDLRAHFDGFRK